MRILLVNDDGINSAGLPIIKKELVKLGNVTVVVPNGERSGFSNSITVFGPLTIQRYFVDKDGVKIYVIGGTPVDCVKLALLELMPAKPDITVSGINFGLNTGSNILYSGTVAGALEAAQFGIPSFAISYGVTKKIDYDGASKIASKIIRSLFQNFSARGVAFNINFPGMPLKKIKGILITHQEDVPYEDYYEKYKDPRGNLHFWLKGNPEKHYKPKLKKADGSILSDAEAVRRGFVSITPLGRNLTHYDEISRMRKMTASNGKFCLFSL